jgi:hypothetical protein
MMVFPQLKFATLNASEIEDIDGTDAHSRHYIGLNENGNHKNGDKKYTILYLQTNNWNTPNLHHTDSATLILSPPMIDPIDFKIDAHDLCNHVRKIRHIHQKNCIH